MIFCTVGFAKQKKAMLPVSCSCLPSPVKLPSQPGNQANNYYVRNNGVYYRDNRIIVDQFRDDFITVPNQKQIPFCFPS